MIFVSMKKVRTPVFVFLFSILLTISPNKSFSQTEKGQVVLTGGAGTSLVGLLFNAITNPANKVQGEVEFKSTPALLGMIDYGIAKRFSLGFAFSYQSFSGTYSNYSYTNSNGIRVIGTFKDKLTRMNYAIRPLFHLGNNEELDLYIGPRIGFTKWDYTTNNADPYYNGDYDGGAFSDRVRVQVLFGVRYFFNEHIGINGELAIGTPYYMMGGINFKF